MLKSRPIHVSALTGVGVDEVLPFAVRIGQAYRVRVPTPSSPRSAAELKHAVRHPGSQDSLRDADQDGAVEGHTLRQPA